MKQKIKELDVEFIGGERSLTKKDEAAISAFIKANKLKHAKIKSSKKANPTRLRRKLNKVK
jgi:hypothetical protein